MKKKLVILLASLLLFISSAPAVVTFADDQTLDARELEILNAYNYMLDTGDSTQLDPLTYSGKKHTKCYAEEGKTIKTLVIGASKYYHKRRHMYYISAEVLVVKGRGDDVKILHGYNGIYLKEDEGQMYAYEDRWALSDMSLKYLFKLNKKQKKIVEDYLASLSEPTSEITNNVSADINDPVKFGEKFSWGETKTVRTNTYSVNYTMSISSRMELTDASMKRRGIVKPANCDGVMLLGIKVIASDIQLVGDTPNSGMSLAKVVPAFYGRYSNDLVIQNDVQFAEFTGSFASKLKESNLKKIIFKDGIKSYEVTGLVAVPFNKGTKNYLIMLDSLNNRSLHFEISK